VFNAETHIKELLYNDCSQSFLQGLITPTQSTEYSLSKVAIKLQHVKQPSPSLWASQGTRKRGKDVEKAHDFAKHLRDFFGRTRQ
jgi:hypothetical protein